MLTRGLDEKRLTWFQEVWRGLTLLERTEIRRIACQQYPMASRSEQDQLMYEFLMARTTRNRVSRDAPSVLEAIKSGRIKI